MAQLTFNETITNTILEELKSNRNSIYISQDLSDIKTNDSIFSSIDHERIINVPVSENAYLGSAVGLYLNGFNVIVNIPGSKYLLNSLDPLINYASKLKAGGIVPSGSLLIRCLSGYSPLKDMQDSEEIASALCYFPGIKIVYPSNASDAKSAIKESFKESDPVILFEHNNLKDTKEYITISSNESVLKSAKIVRKGNDVSVITYGNTVKEVLKASDAAKISSADPEVIDLRTIKPIDKDTIINSVKKTGRAIVVAEGYKTCSIASEVSSIIASSDAFDFLEAPIQIMCNNDKFIPFNDKKAKDILPSSGKILELIMNTIRY